MKRIILISIAVLASGCATPMRTAGLATVVATSLVLSLKGGKSPQDEARTQIPVTPNCASNPNLCR